MPNHLTSLARPASIVASLVFTLLSGAGLAETLTVDDARPVAKAIIELEIRYGQPITYEDPPYIYSGDVAEMGPIYRRDKTVKAGDTSTLVPRGGSLTFTLPASPAADQVLGAVDGVVQSYNTGHGGNVFAVSQGPGLVHVIPQQAASLSGKLEPVTPILSRPVTIAPKERTAFELIDDICNTLSSETKMTVVVGTNPVNFLMSKKTSIGASKEEARSVLDRLLASTDMPLSWQLFYDPGLKWYVLNIHIVRNAKKRL